MKPNLLYKISLILFGASTVALVAAMIIQAIRGENSRAIVAVAIASAVVAFVGIILALLSSKISNNKDETN
ncbi:MAG: hypothetical protein J1E96_04105 [Ruminococcus sp.]|nr:hypothetical protein [Ruminococcus sp.]